MQIKSLDSIIWLCHSLDLFVKGLNCNLIIETPFYNSLFVNLKILSDGCEVGNNLK